MATASVASIVDWLNVRRDSVNLFLVGFLVLFLELACIRWFSAFVIFLQFFTNVVLIACFLGMSCGCLAARQRGNWLAWFPLLALGTFAAALVIMAFYPFWKGLAVDVGHQTSPQEVFFGTEYRNPDVAQFVVPIEWIVAVFFILIALMFVGLGQVLGRAFDAYPNRVLGYTLNIGGSLSGIVGFSALSFAQAPPVVWFLITCAGIAYLLYQAKALSLPRLLALGDVADHCRGAPRSDPTTKRVGRHITPSIARRAATSSSTTLAIKEWCPSRLGGSSYSLIHLLQRQVAVRRFRMC